MVIHGYGSSGKGGAIRTKARQWLNAQVRNGTIKAVINGEDFDIFNFKALELKDKYRELEKLLKVCIGIVNKWIENDCKESISEIIEIIESCMNRK